MSKELLDELYSLKNFVESNEFQKFIMKPLFEELSKIQRLKKYKDWDSVLKAQGKEEGLLWMVNTLKEVDRQIKNTKFELDKEETL